MDTYSFDVEHDPAVFVMPHWSMAAGFEKQWLDETLESIRQQTDPNWHLLIADGNSPSQDARDDLRELAQQSDGQIEVIFMSHSDGPGHARNLAIQRAYEKQYPFIVFLDADDLAHPRRVEIARKHFVENPNVGLVYSTFHVIDEYSQPVPMEKLTQSIVEILESHQDDPPQGKETWIRIATETGYTNLTSTTSVRTQIAYQYQFPPEKVSEDYHTWLRYSASGAAFVYTPLTPTRYRIPQNTEGSVSRTREGGKHGFYTTKCRVDSLGMQEAIKLALQRGTIQPDRADYLLIKFYLKEAETMGREQEMDLAAGCLQNARSLSEEITADLIDELGFAGRPWIG